MKKVDFLIFIVVMLGGTSSCTSFSQKTELKTEIDTMSYYFGFSRTDGIKDYLVSQAGVDTAYMDAFYKGFKEGAKNYSPEDVAYSEGMRLAHMINNQWVKNVNNDIFMGDPSKTINRTAVLSGFYNGVKNPNSVSVMHAQTYSQTIMESIREDSRQKKYAENIAAGEKFLAASKEKEGVKTTSSGLQYKVIKEGSGSVPDEKAKVKVNYRGTLVDGTEFDSSYKNNAPASFFVSQVVSGWTEALKMMPVGSKWELYIPQNLAYGSREQHNIPPYSTLIFEIELLEIEQ